MTESQIDVLRKEIREGFRQVDVRLKSIESQQQQGFAETQQGIADLQQGLHGVMFKILAAAEITEIRATMTNPPDIKNFPRWAIR